MRWILFLSLLLVTLDGSLKAQHTEEIDSLLLILNEEDGQQNIKTLFQLSKILKIDESYIQQEIEGENSTAYSRLLAKTYETAGHQLYYESELDEAIKYIQNALSINQALKDTIGIIGCLNKITHVNIELGEFEMALATNEEALSLSELINNNRSKAESYRNMGIIFFYQNDFKNALKSYFESLLNYKSIKDSADIGFVYNAIGIIYSRWEAADKALLYFNQAEEIYRNEANPRRLSQVLNSKAEVYSFYLNNYDKALELYEESLQLKEQINDEIGIALLYNNIGTVYGSMKNYKKALEYLRKSETIYTKMDNQPGIIMVYYNMGYIYLEYDNFDKAINYFNLSMVAAKKIGYNDYITSNYKALIESYAANCDYENFSKYYKLDMHVTDSMLTILHDAEMLEVEAGLRVAEISYENNILKNELFEQNKIIKRNKFFLISLGLLVFILVVVLSIVSFKKTKHND